MRFCEDLGNSSTLSPLTAEDKTSLTAIHQIQSISLMLLPDEILIRIFRFLNTPDICNRIVCVCRRFNTLSRDYSVWRSIALSPEMIPNKSKKVQRENMLSLICNAFRLTSFTLLAGTSNDANLIVETVAENCPHLRHLSVPDHHVSAKTIEVLVHRCPQLATLRLHGSTLANGSDLASLQYLRTLEVESTILGDFHRIQCCHVIVEIIKRCSSLEELFVWRLELNEEAQQCIFTQPKSRWKGLGLCYCSILADKMHLISECTQLEKLSLFNQRDRFSGLSMIVYPLKSLTKLRSLKLIGFPDSESIDLLHELFRQCAFRDLQSLSIQDCHFGSDALLGQIAQVFPRLTSLDLRGFQAVTDAGLTEVLLKCTLVTDIKIESFGVWLDGSCFLSSAPRLKTLDIITCDGIECNIIDELSNTTNIRINYTESSLLALREIFAET